MDNNNPLQNGLNGNNNEFNSFPNNLPQTDDIQVRHSSANNNFNNSSYDRNNGLSAMNNNHNNFSANTNISSNPNFPQYDSSNNDTIIPPSQSTSNNNSGTPNQYPSLNNSSYGSFQQFASTPNKTSSPQYANKCYPSLNIGININCNTDHNINIVPGNSDTQHHLKQILDHWTSIYNSKTRSQQ